LEILSDRVHPGGYAKYNNKLRGFLGIRVEKRGNAVDAVTKELMTKDFPRQS